MKGWEALPKNIIWLKKLTGDLRLNRLTESTKHVINTRTPNITQQQLKASRCRTKFITVLKMVLKMQTARRGSKCQLCVSPDETSGSLVQAIRNWKTLKKGEHIRDGDIKLVARRPHATLVDVLYWPTKFSNYIRREVSYIPILINFKFQML
jgi:hypothetical protein